MPTASQPLSTHKAYSTGALPNDRLPFSTYDTYRPRPLSADSYFYRFFRTRRASTLPTATPEQQQFSETLPSLSEDFSSYTLSPLPQYTPRVPLWEDVETRYKTIPQKLSLLGHRLRWALPCFERFRLQRKARNPKSCRAIDWDIRRPFIKNMIMRFLLLFSYCLAISVFHLKLGIRCTRTERHEVGTQFDQLTWMRLATGGGFFYVVCQGYGNLRVTRDRMERMAHCCINVAYSFLKGINPASDEAGERDDQQRLVYECMLLCVAYPVAMMNRIRGNVCEPAISRYCREAAAHLKTLRDGKLWDDSTPLSYDFSDPMTSYDDRLTGQQYLAVDHYFESFSLQLEMEYRRHMVVTNKHRPLSAVHITYCLRSHYENLIDLGAIDDRRGPAIREAIELMGALGREMHVNTPRDVRPRVFLWTVVLSAIFLCLRAPLDHCFQIVNSTYESPYPYQIPTLATLKAILFMSAPISLLLTIILEAWALWDPFDKAFTTYAWSLGIAMELDALLNQFHETEPSAMIRKHSYMPSKTGVPKGSITKWAGQPSQPIFPSYPDHHESTFQPGPSLRQFRDSTRQQSPSEQARALGTPFEPGPSLRHEREQTPR